MPTYRRVKADYIAGASWGQLARRYKIDARHLYNHAKVDARRAGDEWPLRDASDRASYASLEAYDRCLAKGLQLELAEFTKWSGLDLKDVAAEAGLSRITIYKITGGAKLTVTRKTRDKIMAVIERHEARRAAA